MAALAHPVVIEIDPKNWKTSLDRAERWFHFVQTAQTAFRKLAEETRPKLHDSHLQGYLTEIIARAREHEGKAAELLHLIGREPKKGPDMTGILGWRDVGLA